MDLSYGRATLAVQPGRPLRLRAAQGRRLAVVRGAVWITQDGDYRDPVLEAGSEFVFDRPGLTVLQALGGEALVVAEDGVEIESAASNPAVKGFWAALGQSWRRRKARAALGELSDRELRDIGICRAQIELIGG